MKEAHVRTCQECGHRQVAKDPATYVSRSESWRELKCRKCKSISMDYGSTMLIADDGSIHKRSSVEPEEE